MSPGPKLIPSVEPSFLGQGQIGALQVLLQYHAHLRGMWVGTRPRVYSLRNSVSQQASTQLVFPYLGSSRRRRVCLLYNCESTPGCSFPNCKFEHIYSLCAKDPHATDKRHKAVMCPHHSTPSSNGELPKKNGIHPGFTTDLTPTTDEYPQLHR